MSDDEIVQLIQFIIDRFYGAEMSDSMILNAMDDWRRKMS